MPIALVKLQDSRGCRAVAELYRICSGCTAVVATAAWVGASLLRTLRKPWATLPLRDHFIIRVTLCPKIAVLAVQAKPLPSVAARSLAVKLRPLPKR